MKKFFAIVLFILGGMILLNSPPVKESKVLTDFTYETTIDLPAMVAAFETQEIQAISMIQPGNVSCHGGLVLQTFVPSWSATIDNLNHYNSYGPETDSWNNKLLREGLFRLDIGEIHASQG